MGILLACALGSSAVQADDVYLENGQVFEDVVAVDGEQIVLIRLEIGQLTLPKSQVKRIVVESSALEQYLSRSNDLRSSPEATASDWMSLANWARSRGLSEGYRSAALMAARLAPELEGVAIAMRRVGYERDLTTGDWVPFEEAMRRQGLVLFEGEWVSPVEVRRRAESQRPENSEVAKVGAAAHQDQPAPQSRETTANDVALAQVELMREMMGKNVGTVSGIAYGTYGVPALPLSGGFGVGHSHRSISASTQRAWDILSVRQPGSILPMSSYRRPGE